MEPNASSKIIMRNPVFDIMKGIGILLVMIGHIPESAYVSIGSFDATKVYEVISKVIGIFHMPMFFLIAGYFMKPYKKKMGGRNFQHLYQESSTALLFPIW